MKGSFNGPLVLFPRSVGTRTVDEASQICHSDVRSVSSRTEVRAWLMNLFGVNVVFNICEKGNIYPNPVSS